MAAKTSRKLTPKTPGEPVVETAEPEKAVDSGLVLTEGDAQADVEGVERPDNNLTAEEQAEIYGEPEEVVQQGSEFSPTITATGLLDEEKQGIEAKEDSNPQYHQGATLTEHGWVLKG